MKRDVKTVAEWDFERIIPCHGVRATVGLYLVTRSNCCPHRMLSRRTVTKRGGRHTNGTSTKPSARLLFEFAMMTSVCNIYIMQLAKNCIVSYIRVGGGEVAQHGSMYLANHEEHETKTEMMGARKGIVSRCLFLSILFDGLSGRFLRC